MLVVEIKLTELPATELKIDLKIKKAIQSNNI